MYRKVIIMKKVRLLIAMMLVVAALTVGVMAAETDYVGFELEEIETGDAITVKVVSKEGFEAAFCTFGVGYTSSKWTISDLSNTTDANIGDGEVGYVKDGSLSIDKDGTILSFTATPVGDAASVVGETFTLTYCTCVSATEEILVDKSEAYDTLTVKAAATDEKVPGSEISATKTELVDGDTFYKNLAVFDAAITLENGRTAKKVGWTLKSTGKAGELDVPFQLDTEISGGGEVNFAAIVYNVPGDVTVTAIPYVVYGN